VNIGFSKGDPLEREYSDFITARLPGYYYQIWSAYIGNDGQANPIFIDLREDDKARRDLFLQHHYSRTVPRRPLSVSVRRHREAR
jgi:hypothetical protein